MPCASPIASEVGDPGAVDAFTAWLLTWQHFILPALAILAFATLYS